MGPLEPEDPLDAEADSPELVLDPLELMPVEFAPLELLAEDVLELEEEVVELALELPMAETSALPIDPESLPEELALAPVPELTPPVPLVTARPVPAPAAVVPGAPDEPIPEPLPIIAPGPLRAPTGA